MSEDRKAGSQARLPAPLGGWRRHVAAWTGVWVVAAVAFAVAALLASGLAVGTEMMWIIGIAVAFAATALYLHGIGGYGIRTIGFGCLFVAAVYLIALAGLWGNFAPRSSAPPRSEVLPDVRPLPSAPRPSPAPPPPPPPTADLVFPLFPWPPPEASARLVLPSRFFAGVAKLRDVAHRLISAFDDERYEYSFLSVPHGFALVTRIERISDDATSAPLPQRWDLHIAASSASLREFLIGLFRAPEGHFRVIAVIVTDIPFGQTDARTTTVEAQQWLTMGFNVLPDQVADLPVTASTQCTALVYEFEGRGFTDTVRVLLPGQFEARKHLEQAGIWRELDGVVQR